MELRSERILTAEGRSLFRVMHDPTGKIGRILAARRAMKTPFRVAEKTAWDVYYNIAEYLGKLRNDWRVKVEYLIRYGARVVAQYSEKTVVSLNDLSPVNKKQACDQALGAKKNPGPFHPRLSRRLGSQGNETDSARLHSRVETWTGNPGVGKGRVRQKDKPRAFRRLIEETPRVHLSGKSRLSES